MSDLYMMNDDPENMKLWGRGPVADLMEGFIAIQNRIFEEVYGDLFDTKPKEEPMSMDPSPAGILIAEPGTYCKFRSMTQVGHAHVVLPPHRRILGDKSDPEARAIQEERRRIVDDAFAVLRRSFQRTRLEWPVCPVHGPVPLHTIRRHDENYVAQGVDHEDLWMQFGCGLATAPPLYPGPEMAKPLPKKDITINDLYYETGEDKRLTVPIAELWTRKLLYCELTNVKGAGKVTRTVKLGDDLRTPPAGFTLQSEDSKRYAFEKRREIRQIWVDHESKLELIFEERPPMVEAPKEPPKLNVNDFIRFTKAMVGEQNSIYRVAMADARKVVLEDYVGFRMDVDAQGLELARPRIGEWWQEIVCSQHGFITGKPMQIQTDQIHYDSEWGRRLAHGCLAPVNFGRG